MNEIMDLILKKGIKNLMDQGIVLRLLMLIFNKHHP